MTRAILAAVLLAILAAIPAPAQGHGPIFGLSTPTLGAGGWSVDLGGMSRRAGGRWAAMFRPMLSYGVTEDIQVSASFPVPLVVPTGLPPSRGAARMPATRDLEMLGGWRFHRQAFGVGSRFETTLWAGIDLPLDEVRAGLDPSPTVVTSLVTGIASRSVYAWLGGLHRRELSRTGDRAGDLSMASLVLGWRPPAFRRDYPHPDWRLFLEVLVESSGRDRRQGAPLEETGGSRVLAGPTVLGLFGSWGISGGPLLPVRRRLNGDQPTESIRFAMDLIFWF